MTTTPDDLTTQLAETAMPLIHTRYLKMVSDWGDDYSGSKTPAQSAETTAMVKDTLAEVAEDGIDSIKTLTALAVILEQLANLHD